MGGGDCKKCTAFWGVLGLLTLVLLVMLLISASTDKTEQSFPSAVRLEAGGVYVKLEDNLKPKSVENEKGKKQSELMEVWTRDNEVAKDKRFKLGSEEMVNFGPDKGFFSTVQAAWNNHWVLNSLLCTFMCYSLNREIKMCWISNIFSRPKQCKYKVAMYLFIQNTVLQNWSVFSGVRDFEQKPVYQPLSLRQTQRSTAAKR